MDIIFTQDELIILHRVFLYPLLDKLLSLFKIARPWEVDCKTKEVLKDIQKRFLAFEHFYKSPIRLKFTFSTEDNLLFSGNLNIDLIWLNVKAALHIADTATCFSAATFLYSNGATYGKSEEVVWLAFVET